MNTSDKKSQEQPQDQRLDQLLHEWADMKSPEPQQLSTLKQSVLQQMADSEQAPEEPLTLNQVNRDRTWRYAAGVSALAATLLIAFGLGRHWGKQESLEMVSNQPPGDLNLKDRSASLIFDPASMRPLQTQQRRRILDEFQGVFDRQIAWIADVDGELKVGLAPTGQNKSAPDHRYLAIRLTLLSSTPSQTGWEVEQSYEVLASTEELLQVPLSTDDDSKLTVWAYPVEDGLVSIETKCHLAGAYSQQVDASHLQTFGQHNRIHTFEKDGIEYRLYQTAVLLEDDTLKSST